MQGMSTQMSGLASLLSNTACCGSLMAYGVIYPLALLKGLMHVVWVLFVAWLAPELVLMCESAKRALIASCDDTHR